jgi:hypothetical protein
MPSVRAFCLNEPSDLFISFESLATGVRDLECALSSLTSSFVYSLRLLVAFFAIFMFSIMVVRPRNSTPNSLIKRTDVNKVFCDDHCTW